MLSLFADHLGQSLQAGTSLADFRQAIRPALQAKGFWGDVEVSHPTTGEARTTRFDDARLKLIYDVNLRQSYAAGTWARAVRTEPTKPLLSYRTMRDERVRISHRPWDGVALPIGHPWWSTHYPPNGWRCRCTAFAVSEQDLARLQAAGLPVKRTAPEVVTTTFVNRSTGEVSQVPVGIDPGFAYNPGQVRQQQVALLQRQALDAAPPDLARAMTQQTVIGQNFAQFVASPSVPQQAMPVAMLNPPALPALPAPNLQAPRLPAPTLPAPTQQAGLGLLLARHHVGRQHHGPAGGLLGGCR